MVNDNQNMAQLLESSRDKDPYVRLRALQSLTKMNDPRSIPALLAALSDTEPPLRAAAAKALGKLQAGQAKWQLLERLGDESIAVCHAAAEALGEIADPDAVPGLSLTLKNAQEPVLRLAAVHALSEIGGNSALLLLQAAARDEADDVRKAASHAIESIRSQQSENTTVLERIAGEFPFRWGFIALLLAATAVPLMVYYGLQGVTPATPNIPTATLQSPTETSFSIPVDYNPVDAEPLPVFVSDRFIVFDSGQGTSAYDNMTYCEYESQITLTLENDVIVRAVRPIINTCNGDCGYTVSVRTPSMQLLGSQSGEVRGDQPTAAQLFNLDKPVEIKKGTPFILLIRVWSDYSVGILTTGNRTSGVKGLGQYTVDYASSACSDEPVVDHLARGSVSFQLFE